MDVVVNCTFCVPWERLVPMVQGILNDVGVAVRVGGGAAADTSTSTEMVCDIPPPATVMEPVYVPAEPKYAVLREKPRLPACVLLTLTLDAPSPIHAWLTLADKVTADVEVVAN